ncbi:Uncharacterised protein [Mycolicibacterium vanbaalenii]|uniref:Uncharacterized protein n=1 Tax=Mycolicibacterium vanbaalenii TaxID=110539 RepID=A0A5S9RA16_MYCVN|nr:hypothetical protein [Mycolicibacterium vanbaalenii]CAA0134967.1 Uncharacterised protein [Mycolicibacterium vanbaalenii]
MNSKPVGAACKTLVDMSEYTETLSRPARAPERAATPAEPVFISVAEVLLGSVAADSTVGARPAGAPHDWWTRRAARRAHRRRAARRRPDYFEHAAMAREMHRL